MSKQIYRFVYSYVTLINNKNLLKYFTRLVTRFHKASSSFFFVCVRVVNLYL